MQGSVLARSENAGKLSLAPKELTLVPFYANDNRGADELRVWLAASADKAMPSTLAMRSRASASYCRHEDSVQAINDGIVPTKSSDTEGSRLSWWDHKGMAEWAELDLPQATEVSRVRLFWFADRPVNGGCDLPQNWVTPLQGRKRLGSRWITQQVPMALCRIASTIRPSDGSKRPPCESRSSFKQDGLAVFCNGPPSDGVIG